MFLLFYCFLCPPVFGLLTICPLFCQSHFYLKQKIDKNECYCYMFGCPCRCFLLVECFFSCGWLNDNLSGKELFICFTVRVFCSFSFGMGTDYF